LQEYNSNKTPTTITKQAGKTCPSVSFLFFSFLCAYFCYGLC
jgi:hypothetical protein